MPLQQEYDEYGKPVAASALPEYDEHGNPVSGASASSSGNLSLPGPAEMKPDTWYSRLARGALSMLPAAGMVAGSAVSAPAAAAAGPLAPAVSAGGAAIGAGAGEATRQLLARGIYGKGPTSSGEAAKDISGQMEAGAASEIPLAGYSAKLKVPTSLSPEESAAVAYGEKAGLPINAGTASGSPLVKGAQKILRSQPLASPIVSDAQMAERTALADKAHQMASKVGQAGTSEYDAASKIGDLLKAKMKTHDLAADANYSQLRDIAARNPTEIPDQPEVPNSSIDQQTAASMGSPIGPTAVPASTKQITGAVDLGPIQDALAPLSAAIHKEIAFSQNLASPGLRAADEILRSPRIVDLNTALGNLSAIMSESRTAIPELRDRSQGILSSIVPKAQKAIGDAVAQLGPEATSKWQAGRAETTSKHATGDLLKSLFGENLDREPVQVARALTGNADRNVDRLRQVADQVPNAIPDLAHAHLDNLLSGGIDSGQLSKGGTLLSKWQALGPATKAILYGPQKTKELDNLFRLAKMTTEDVNPSGTGPIAALYGTGRLLIKSPATAAATILSGKKLAQILMAPDGPALVRQGLTLPLGSPAAKAWRAAILGRSIYNANTRMEAPDGTQQDVDPSQVQHYQNLGATVAQ